MTDQEYYPEEPEISADHADSTPADAITPEPVQPDMMPLEETPRSWRDIRHNLRRSFDPINTLVYVLLALIVAVGAWLRFDAQNWDDFTHLHPDERFITQVVESLNGTLKFTDSKTDNADGTPGPGRLFCEKRYPADSDVAGFSEKGRGGYFDADCSPFNPHNVGYGMYVYGEFPLFTTYLAAEGRTQFSQDYHTFLETFDPGKAKTHRITTYWRTYTGAQLIGRSVAAAADVLTILVLFLLGRRLYGRWTGLLAAFLYAVAAFPIQQSHFWTVDTFTTFWVTLSLYFAVRALDGASRGQTAPAYLVIWAVGVLWETVRWEYPVLGLVTLAGSFAAALVVALSARFLLRVLGFSPEKMPLVAVGALASAIYLSGWAGLIVTAAKRDFPLDDGLLALGLAGLVYGLVIIVAYQVGDLIRRRSTGQSGRDTVYLAAGAIAIAWIALLLALLSDGLETWAVLVVGGSAISLLVLDHVGLTDFALFGLAVGATVASRINMAPLAVIIVLAAGIRALSEARKTDLLSTLQTILKYMVIAAFVAGIPAFLAFRVLQPHAFSGPGFFDLRFDKGWRDDASEAAWLTSGNWDGPPNHQWTSRTPYLFPWRNIVEWGLGIPLGLVAWIAWAATLIQIVRAWFWNRFDDQTPVHQQMWARHVIPAVWILLMFGWLGGRWVTTMRYFLPLYPALTLLGAWGLLALLRWARSQPIRVSRPVLARIAFVGTSLLLVVVIVYTAGFGFAFHNIQRHQLTRVAASRWFQETVPGDFGMWVQGDDGTQKLINVGLIWAAPAPSTTHLEQGDIVEFNTLPGYGGKAVPFTLPGDATLTQISLFKLGDPARDPDEEVVRVRLFREDPSLGRQLEYEGEVRADLNDNASPYGGSHVLTPDQPIPLRYQPDSMSLPYNYTLQVSVIEGGPVMFSHGLTEASMSVVNDISVGLQLDSNQTITAADFNMPEQLIITGYSDEGVTQPTQYTVGGADTISFDVPIDGTISEIIIPHLGDPLRDADEESVTFTVVAPDGSQSSATITADFNADANPLGSPQLGGAQTIQLDPPLHVSRLVDANGYPVTGKLIVQTHDPIYTSGPVIAWDGDWDDPVPWSVCSIPDDVEYSDDLPSGLSRYDCAALGMYPAFYQGLKLWMFWEDNSAKYAGMKNTLDQADYVVLTSNRFYDTLTRIPMRWPMSVRFYKALFDGSLGFELDKTFTSYPRLGPITIPDEILPSDNLPNWLNEHWEAEEAYHVYDHPAVLVFKKTAAYTSENMQAILQGDSLVSTRDIYPAFATDVTAPNVIPWAAKLVTKAKTALMFDAKKWDIQREGGTWSDLFDLDSLVNRSQVLAVIVWWLLIVIVGWLTWPLLFCIFPALPDRGFPMAKIIGWLLVAWVAWAGGTFNILTWTRPGLLIVLVGLILLSLGISFRRRDEMIRYIRANRRHLLAVEGLTLLLFLVMLGIRLGNPDLWHSSFGGEKPMDFSYFNAVLRSTVFPPIDPWFSGGYMNYYYFGYVVVGAPVKLIGIQPSVAYNLILPTLYAMTGIGVFSIAYNWVRSRAIEPGQIEGATRDSSLMPLSEVVEERREFAHEPRLPAGSAWMAGTVAMLLAVVLGNLGDLHVFVTNVAAMDGYVKRPLLSQVRRQELNDKKPDIFEDFYHKEEKKFREEHGYNPETPDEIFQVNQDAQEATNWYIARQAQHAPLRSIWEYEYNGLSEQVKAFKGGLKQLMDGKPLPMATHRWYWAPTRIIGELPNGAGQNAIAEMPFFTYLYGDLHAHMIAMPLTLIVLLWLTAEMIGAGYHLRRWWEAGLALALGGLTVGVLRPANSWDWITYLLVGAAGLSYVAWIGAARSSRDDPPSRAEQQLRRWIRPGNGLLVAFVLALVVPIAIAARVVFYYLRKTQAEEQAKHPLDVGEKAINATLTASGILVWIVAALALVVLAYVLALVLARAHVSRRWALLWLGRVGLFLGITVIAAMPFTKYFATNFTAIKPWATSCTASECFIADRTPLWTYLYVHGLFIFIAASFLIWQAARLLRRFHMSDLEGQIIPVIIVFMGMIGLVIVSVVIGVRDIPALQLAGPMIGAAVLLFFMPRQHPLLRAITALIALALIITIGVEVIVLDGDIGRQNTVFKFYIQVWFLFSIACGIALAWMLRGAGRWNLALRAAWQTVLAILCTIALAYPVLATQARFLDRFNADKTPLTLDGMEFMKYAVHGENNVYFALDSDYRLIRWMQENVEGSPVVMEAHAYPSEYRWDTRIAFFTGLPTILGWRNHQTQQRSLPEMDKLIYARENNVAAFYMLDDMQAAWKVIETYDVGYVVVGIAERVLYNDITIDALSGYLTPGHQPGITKLDTMAAMGWLDVVYQSADCLDPSVVHIEDCPPQQVYIDKVYRVVPGAGPSSEVVVQ